MDVLKDGEYEKQSYIQDVQNLIQTNAVFTPERSIPDRRWATDFINDTMEHLDQMNAFSQLPELWNMLTPFIRKEHNEQSCQKGTSDTSITLSNSWTNGHQQTQPSEASYVLKVLNSDTQNLRSILPILYLPSQPLSSFIPNGCPHHSCYHLPCPVFQRL